MFDFRDRPLRMETPSHGEVRHVMITLLRWKGENVNTDTAYSVEAIQVQEKATSSVPELKTPLDAASVALGDGDKLSQFLAGIKPEHRFDTSKNDLGNSHPSNPGPSDSVSMSIGKPIDPALLARAVEEAKSRGNIANTDDFRPLIRGYEDGDWLTRDAEFFQETADLNYAVVDELLKQPPINKIAIILAGGGGSGKSTVLSKIKKPRDLVIDTTFSSERGSKKTLQDIEDSGRDAVVVYVHRPFHLAFEGVITRYLEGKKANSPRMVPLHAVARAHVGAQETTIARAKEGATVWVFDNSGKITDIATKDIDFLIKQRYVKIHEQPAKGSAPNGEGSSGPIRQGGSGGGHPSSEGGGKAAAESRLIERGNAILERYRAEGKLTDREVQAFKGDLAH